MNNLHQQHCEACSQFAKAVNESEIQTLLTQLDNWQLVEVNTVKQLQKSFTFSDFKTAMDFTQQLAQLAEANDHHPRIVTEWGLVTVNWWTHAINNLHLNDFILAAKTDELLK